MNPAEPRAREGAEAQRLRVGALGLAAVFLLVMLATALLHATADPELANQAGANAAEPAEPLAQLGVAPGNPVGGNAAAAAVGAPMAAPATAPVRGAAGR